MAWGKGTAGRSCSLSKGLRTWRKQSFLKTPKYFTVAEVEFEFGVGWGEKAGDNTHGLRFGLYPDKE